MFWRKQPAAPVLVAEQVTMSQPMEEIFVLPPLKTATINYQILTGDAVYNATTKSEYSDSFNETNAAEVLIYLSYHLVDNHMVIPKHSVTRINITKIIKE